MEKRPPKLPDVRAEAQRLVKQGFLVFSSHAVARMSMRRVLKMDVVRVLREGNRVERHDVYDEERSAWKYAMEGLSLDGARTVRVIFVIGDEPPLPNRCVRVITVLDPSE